MGAVCALLSDAGLPSWQNHSRFGALWRWLAFGAAVQVGLEAAQVLAPVGVQAGTSRATGQKLDEVLLRCCKGASDLTYIPPLSIQNGILFLLIVVFLNTTYHSGNDSLNIRKRLNSKCLLCIAVLS